MIWILVGYMWLFLHRPFEVWPILATIRLERSYMICTLIVWFAISAKTWTSNRNNAALFFVAFSIFISTLLSPYAGLGDNLRTENWFKVFVFFLLIMTSVKTEKDLKILVTAFVICFTLYMLHSYREYRCGKGHYTMGTWRMIGVDSTMGDPNTFGNGINYAICLLLPLLALAKEVKQKNHKRLLYLLWLGSFGLSIWCIQLTGSRSSFMVLGISLFGLSMLSKYRVRLLLLFAIASPLLWFSLGENLQNRFRSIWDPSYAGVGAQTFEQRTTAGFHTGIAVWKEHMLFGAGPGGVMKRVDISMGFETHQLYGQVLGELGILGAIAYLTLVFAMLSNHWTAHQLYHRMKRLGREKEALYLYRVSFGVAWAVFLLLLLGMGGHNAFRFTWVWYAAFQAIAVELLRQKANFAMEFDQKIRDHRQLAYQRAAA